RIDTDASVRKMASLGTTAAAGWVRLPFKPVRLNRVRADGKLLKMSEKEALEWEFTVDQASAYCKENAKGSMQIPVPPGATRIKAFRIAGTTSKSVKVQLFRSGWNRA